MRALIVVAMLGSRAIAAPTLRHEDPELVRPELIELTAIHYVPKSSGWVEDAREIRTYDPTGHVIRYEHRKPDGSLVVAYNLTWDAQGRLTSRTYQDNTKRVERRDFTYKVDAKGRIVERIMRDPSKPAGEYYRDDYTWHPDGSRDIRTYRHSPKEGPYPDGSEIYDAKGRLTRHCHEHGGCSMYELDPQGSISRVREQNKEDHHYHVHENTYDKAGKLTRRVIGNTEEHLTWNARGDVGEILEKTIAAQGGAVNGKRFYTYKYR